MCVRGSPDLRGIQKVLAPVRVTHSKVAEIYWLKVSCYFRPQRGRLRQHRAQPMWDAFSQSQTTLPWSQRFKGLVQGRKAPQARAVCTVGRHSTRRWKRGRGQVSRPIPLGREDNCTLRGWGRSSFPDEQSIIFCNLGYCDYSVLFKLYKLLSYPLWYCPVLRTKIMFFQGVLLTHPDFHLTFPPLHRKTKKTPRTLGKPLSPD